MAAGADLFGWQAMEAAKAALLDARARADEARRKALFAPHGLKREREALLRQAVAESLKAELDLAQLKAEFDA